MYNPLEAAFRLMARLDKDFMKPIFLFLLFVGFLSVSFLSVSCVKSQTRKETYSVIGSCKDKALSFRAGRCVRESDQCPSDRINADQTCKQVPCSAGLYYDGTYCVSSPGVNVRSSFVSASFIDICLSPLTNDQKYTFSAILQLAEQGETLKDLSTTTLDVRCGAAFGKLSQVKTNKLEIPFRELRDLTPLAAFDDLPDIKRLVIDVSTSSTMTCPLQDRARCIFRAW